MTIASPSRTKTAASKHNDNSADIGNRWQSHHNPKTDSAAPRKLHQHSTIDIASRWEQTTRLVEQQQYTEALAIYNNLIGENTTLTDFQLSRAYYNRGAILHEIGSFSKAASDADQALYISNYTFADAWYLKGGILESLERDSDAFKAFKKALELKPDDPEFNYIVGRSLVQLNSFNEALKKYDIALQLKSDFYDAWFGKGVAHVELQEYEQSVAAYRSAIDIKSDDAKAWSNIGLSLIYLKQYSDAIEAYTRAIDLDPEFSQNWYNRACAYSLNGNHLRAIQDLSQAIEIEPGWQKEAQLESDFQNIFHLEKFKILLSLSQSSTPAPEESEESPNHPWMKFAGMYNDDPTFDEYIERIAAYRREIDEGRDVPEETIADRIREILN